MDSPAGLVTSGEALDCNCSAAFAQILLTSQPTTDGFLDADAGSSQLVCPEFLEVCNLASPKEDLGFTKLVFILILKIKTDKGEMSDETDVIILYSDYSVLLLQFIYKYSNRPAPVSPGRFCRSTFCRRAHPSASSGLCND